MAHQGDGAAADPEDVWRRASAHALRSSEHFVNSVLEANRALATTFDATPSSSADSDDVGLNELAYTDRDWTAERTADTRAELGVGDSVRFTKRLSDDDVRSYAQITGDTNRLHLDDEYAEGTRFGRRIVHGGLVSGLVSSALARLPGTTVYLSESFEFRAPADIGDTFTAVVEIVEDLGDDQYRLDTLVRDEDTDETLVEGEAVVLVDEPPESSD